MYAIHLWAIIEPPKGAPLKLMRVQKHNGNNLNIRSDSRRVEFQFEAPPANHNALSRAWKVNKPSICTSIEAAFGRPNC